MRYLVGLMMCVLAGGCARSSSERPVEMVKPAAALVFAPAEMTPVDLPRAERQPLAVIGFEELTTSTSYVRIDDRQDSYGDRQQRRAVVEAYTVRVR